MLLLECYLEIADLPIIALEPSILASQLIVLVILVLDHSAELLFLAVVLVQVVLELPGFVLVLFGFCLPVLYLASQFIDILFELASYLLALGDLDLVVAVVVDLGMQLQFLVL